MGHQQQPAPAKRPNNDSPGGGSSASGSGSGGAAAVATAAMLRDLASTDTLRALSNQQQGGVGRTEGQPPHVVGRATGRQPSLLEGVVVLSDLGTEYGTFTQYPGSPAAAGSAAAAAEGGGSHPPSSANCQQQQQHAVVDRVLSGTTMGNSSVMRRQAIFSKLLRQGAPEGEPVEGDGSSSAGGGRGGGGSGRARAACAGCLGRSKGAMQVTAWVAAVAGRWEGGRGSKEAGDLVCGPVDPCTRRPLLPCQHTAIEAVGATAMAIGAQWRGMA